jgi:porin
MRGARTGFVCTSLALLSMRAFGMDCDRCNDSPAIALAAVYSGDVWRNTSGGIATGDRYLDNIDLTLDVDGAALFGVEGLKLFGYLLYNNGHVLSDDLVGSAQGISNIETTQAVRLYELWMEWQLGHAPGTVRFGLYDLNSEFDAIETASLFLNPSHGIGIDFSQSGGNGPSIFPTTSLAMRAMTSRGPWSVHAAVLDGVPGDATHPNRTRVRFDRDDGFLLVGEVNYKHASGLRLGGGYWHYTADFDDLTALNADGAPVRRDDNSGYYVVAETPQFFAADSDSGLRFFVRAGRAQEHINAVGLYRGAGAVYTGLLSGNDQIGIAVAIAELGDPYRSAQTAAGITTQRRERNWELSYRRAVTDWLTLQPDLQYVVNPGMRRELDAAWVVGLRFEVGHSWQH